MSASQPGLRLFVPGTANAAMLAESSLQRDLFSSAGPPYLAQTTRVPRPDAPLSSLQASRCPQAWSLQLRRGHAEWRSSTTDVAGGVHIFLSVHLLPGATVANCREFGETQGIRADKPTARAGSPPRPPALCGGRAPRTMRALQRRWPACIHPGSALRQPSSGNVLLA